MARPVRIVAGVFAVAVVLGCGNSKRDGGSNVSRGGSAGSFAGASGSAGASSGGASGAAGSAGAGAAIDGDGTRLKRIMLRSGDAEVRSVTWRDTLLGASCLFVYGTCRIGDGMGVVYEDANCTVPLLMLSNAQCYDAFPDWIPRAGEGALPSEACGEYEVYTSTGETVSPATVYLPNGTACDPYQPEPNTRLFRATLSPEHLVRSSYAIRERAPGMDAYVRETEDGSWSIEHFYDREHSRPCDALLPPYDPAYRCVPAPHWSYQSYFTDPLCSIEMLPDGPPCSDEYSAFLHTSGTDCGARSYEVFELGERVSGPRYEKSSSTTCVEDTAASGSGIAIGPELDPNALALVERSELGTGRLRAPVLGFAGIPFKYDSTSGAFLDSDTGEYCDTLQFSDGATRCVPRTFARPSGEYYVDASCTGTRAFLLPTVPCQPVPTGVLTRSECTWVMGEVHLVSPFTGTTLYAPTAGGDCVTQDLANVSGADAYVSTGLVDPATRFAPIEVSFGE